MHGSKTYRSSPKITIISEQQGAAFAGKGAALAENVSITTLPKNSGPGKEAVDAPSAGQWGALIK